MATTTTTCKDACMQLKDCPGEKHTHKAQQQQHSCAQFCTQEHDLDVRMRRLTHTHTEDTIQNITQGMNKKSLILYVIRQGSKDLKNLIPGKRAT